MRYLIYLCMALACAFDPVEAKPNKKPYQFDHMIVCANLDTARFVQSQFDKGEERGWYAYMIVRAKDWHRLMPLTFMLEHECLYVYYLDAELKAPKTGDTPERIVVRAGGVLLTAPREFFVIRTESEAPKISDAGVIGEREYRNPNPTAVVELRPPH